jgi:UDP-N-acetylmuramoylalanine--D-glutamate ligase
VRVCELAGKRVGLWGAGREAQSAYRALSALAPPSSFTVVSDEPASSEQRAQFAGGDAPVSFSDGEDTQAALGGCEVVIRSPGVSRYRPEIAMLERAGVGFTTATNLWMAEHPDAPAIAVTGTKGKSTTSSLIAHMARSDGAGVVLAGNIGVPLLDYLHPAEPVDLWVLELSSYQTADLERSPRVAVLLNLYPEHIDWHGSHERYYRDKLNVLRDSERVLAVLNARDERLRAIAPPANTVWFARSDSYDARGQEIRRDGEVLLRAEDSPLSGEHNALNICAALAALEAFGRPVSDVAGALTGFQALPHRLQLIHVAGRVSYIDDGISTTPQSTMAALAALAGTRVALIAGGYDRGQDYSELAQAILNSGVAAVVALPDTGERLLEEVRAYAAQATLHAPLLIAVQGMHEAVQRACEALGGEGVVLLSPAAPSFGAYRDFKERSQHFIRAATDSQALEVS